MQSRGEHGIINIEPNGILEEKNELRIQKFKHIQYSQTDELLKEYKGVCKRIGLIQSPKTGKEIRAQLEMGENEIHVAKKPRYEPYPLEEPLKN